MEGLSKLACSDITESTHLKKLLKSKKATVQLQLRYLIELTDLESETHRFVKKMKDSKEHER